MKEQLENVQGQFVDNEEKIEDAIVAAQDAADTADIVEEVGAWTVLSLKGIGNPMIDIAVGTDEYDDVTWCKSK